MRGETLPALTLRLRGRQFNPTISGPLLACGALFGLLAACGSPPGEDGDATAKPGWRPPVVLAEAAVFDSSGGVSLSGDGAGRVVAAWVPATTPTPEVLARVYSPSGGWMPVEIVAPAGTGSAGTPSVRMNKRGDALAVWAIFGGISASVRGANGSWDHTVLLVRGELSWWSLGLDDAGNALVACSSRSGLFSRRFEPGSGWRGLEAVPGAVEVDRLDPALAVSGTGVALLAWSTTTGEVWANSFDPRAGWSPASRLSPQPELIHGINTFVNARGHGVVTWYQRDPASPDRGAVLAGFYEHPIGFRPAELLGTAVGTAMAASVDLQNASLLIYMSGLGLRVQRHAAASGWSAPEPLEGVGGYDAVSLDDSGNGWIFWGEPGASSQGAVSLRSRRLEGGRAVGAVEELSPSAPGHSWFRGVSMDAQGGVSTAWFRLTSEPGSPARYALMAARYNPARTDP